MARPTILISSAGRRVALLGCFRHAARELGLDMQILACDREPELSAACHMADQAFKVPDCGSDDFTGTLLEIAREHDVQLIVPTIDPELMPLASAAELFTQAGTRVHVSPPSVIATVRDKLSTIKALERAGVPTPWTFFHEVNGTAPPEIGWPAFLKPACGSASRGIQVIAGPAELPSSPSEPMIIQQLLRGPEYTVSMFIDQHGELRSALAHHRLQVRAGEVEKGRTERSPIFWDLAEGILNALPAARGILCFQVIIDRAAGPRVFEINGRFGGGYPLAHHAGAEYTRFLLEEVMGLPDTAHDRWRDGVTMLRYDEAVFSG